MWLVFVCQQEMKAQNESWWRSRSWPESSSSWDSCSRTWRLSSVSETPLSSMASGRLGTAWPAGRHPGTRGPHLWRRPASTASCLTLEAPGPESTSSSSGWRTEVWRLPWWRRESIPHWSCVVAAGVPSLDQETFRSIQPGLSAYADHPREVSVTTELSESLHFLKNVPLNHVVLLVFRWDFRAPEGGPVHCPCLPVELHSRPPEGHGWPPTAAWTESSGPAGHGQTPPTETELSTSSSTISIVINNLQVLPSPASKLFILDHFSSYPNQKCRLSNDRFNRIFC